MTQSYHSRSRVAAARLAVAGALCAGSLAAAPSALASPTSSVSSHVHRADVALSAVASTTASGQVSLSLAQLTAQLGAAAKVSADLAVHAHTPKLRTIAVSALKLVAGEEARANATLKSVTSEVSGAAQAVAVKAEIEITHGLELSVNGLARLAADARAKAHVGTGEVAQLASDAQGLLAKLAVETTPEVNGCPSASTFADVAARAAASEEAKVRAALSSPVIGDVVNAGGSLFATVTADEVAKVKAQALVAVSCPATNPADGQQGTPGGSGTVSAGGGSSSAGGDNSSAGSSSAGSGGKRSGGGYEAGAGIGPVSVLVKLGL
jgi:hypothetical protein